MKAEILVLKGKNSGLLVQVGQELTVGRDAGCDLQLFDQGISGTHLRVYFEDDDFFVEDLGSGLGTFVFESRLEAPRPVYHQDLICCGEATLQFFCSEALHPGRSAVDLWAESSDSVPPLSLEDYSVEEGSPQRSPSGRFHSEMINLCLLVENISRGDKPQQVIGTLIESLEELIPYHRIVFIRYDSSDGRLIPTKHRRAPSDAPGGWWKVNRRLIDKCCKSGTAVSHAPPGSAAALVAPLKGRAGIVGAIYMEVDASDSVMRQLQLLGAICGQAGLALERCQLMSRVRHQNMQLKESNAARQVEQLKLRTLLDSLSEGVALLDEQGEVLIANPLGEQYLSALQLLGPEGRITQISGEPLGEFAGPEQFEHDDRTYVVSLAHTRTEDWRGYGLMVRDVTEELQARHRLIQAERLSSLGQTVSGVAHELNNPLTGVLGFSELLMNNDGISPETAKQVGIIHREAERCRRIVKNLLTFARKAGPELGSVELNSLLDEVLELKEYELKVHDVELVRDCVANLPVTYADAHQLKQLFLNLVHNAFQAVTDSQTKQGGQISLTIAAEQDQLIVQVADTGPGIPEENIARVFDPFFTTKEVGRGVGLGLSLSYGIVQEHGGELTVESTLGEGACFTVRLPVREVPEEVQLSEGGSTRLGSSGQGTLFVLVVDDEEVVRELIAVTLEKLGWRFELARSGREALRMATERRYDCMICDLKMPGMGGEDLYDALKRRGNEIVDRTLFMSGDVVNERSHGFLIESGCPYVLKPFSLVQIERALRELPGVTIEP